MPKSQVISSYVLTEMLATALDFDPSQVYRIVIDATVNEPVSIEIYQWGTDAVVELLQSLNPTIESVPNDNSK